MRARGRFTRNFVVQASAADWASVLLAGLRRRLAKIDTPNGTGGPLTATRDTPSGAGQGQGQIGPAQGGDSPAQSGADQAQGGTGQAHLVFFQHDEVIVHCPQALAPQVVSAIGDAAGEAGRLVFGQTPVRFPVTTAVVASYADAK
jgi:DNA polymerase-1